MIGLSRLVYRGRVMAQYETVELFREKSRRSNLVFKSAELTVEGRNQAIQTSEPVAPIRLRDPFVQQPK